MISRRPVRNRDKKGYKKKNEETRIFSFFNIRN